jgi:hypothetical protein
LAPPVLPQERPQGDIDSLVQFEIPFKEIAELEKRELSADHVAVPVEVLLVVQGRETLLNDGDPPGVPDHETGERELEDPSICFVTGQVLRNLVQELHQDNVHEGEVVLFLGQEVSAKLFTENNFLFFLFKEVLFVGVTNGTVESVLHAHDFVERHLDVGKVLDEQFQVHVHEGVMQTNAVLDLLLVDHHEVSIHLVLHDSTLSGFGRRVELEQVHRVVRDEPGLVRTH